MQILVIKDITGLTNKSTLDYSRKKKKQTGKVDDMEFSGVFKKQQVDSPNVN